MITTSIFPGRYVQGANALDLLGTEAERLGEYPLVLADTYVIDNIYAELLEPLQLAMPFIMV